MHIPFHQMPIAAANDRCNNPQDRNLASFEESETFPSIEKMVLTYYCVKIILA